MHMYQNVSVSKDFAGFTPDEEANRRALAAEDWWYKAGSALYSCSRILNDQSDLTPFKKFYVGDVESANISDDSVLQSYKDRVEDMLIGMAIEAWLKGLIIAAGPEVSRDLQNQVQEKIDARLVEMGKSEDYSWADIDEAMQSPEISCLLEQMDEKSRLTEIERAALIANHQSHDLKRMADAVGFEPPLEDNHTKALRYYAQMIHLGRYPALNKPRDLVQVNNAEALEMARNELFKLIFSKCNSLGLPPFEGQSKGVT